MLGMVFTEFIEMVEQKFSPEMADAIIGDVAPPSGGAYTAVGYYDHGELVAMVVALSRHTGVPVPDLVKAFGQHLLARFTELYPAMFSARTDLLDFLASIDGHIHVEVRKLYHEAKLPSFTVLERSMSVMRLLYRSPRSMEPLALGLLQGAADFYKEPCTITMLPWSDSDGGSGTVFEISLHPSKQDAPDKAARLDA